MLCSLYAVYNSDATVFACAVTTEDRNNWMALMNRWSDNKLQFLAKEIIEIFIETFSGVFHKTEVERRWEMAECTHFFNDWGGN